MTNAPNLNGRCFQRDYARGTVLRVLSGDELNWLSDRAICKTREPGHNIFHEGTECTGIHFVHEGLVGVRRSDVDGNSVLIRLAQRGDPLGYWTMLLGECHQSTAEVLQPSHTCFINASCMHEILHRNPAFAMEFLRHASRDISKAQERFCQTVTLNLRARLIHFLLLMKNRYGHVTDDGTLLIDLPISRSDMAEMIGVRTESLSRTIHQMTDDGVLEFSGRHVSIDTADLLIEELYS